MSDSRIVYSIDADTVASAFLASILRNKIIVFDAHEIFHEVPELANRPFKKYIWKLISKIFYPKIKNKFTVNQSLKNIFKTQFITDFKVIRNVPLAIESSGETPSISFKSLVYLGVLNKGRGIELAIESLVTLTDYNLTLIGGGDLIEDLKALSNKLNVSSRVKFLGYQEPSHINELLTTSSIGLNMLDPTSDNYKYSLANKFFDYMHAGLPSINMNFPEYANIIMESETAIMAEEYSVNGLIECVTQLENIDFYSMLQNNCLQAKRIYNWQQESKKLLAVFNNAK